MIKLKEDEANEVQQIKEAEFDGFRPINCSSGDTLQGAKRKAWARRRRLSRLRAADVAASPDRIPGRSRPARGPAPQWAVTSSLAGRPALPRHGPGPARIWPGSSCVPSSSGGTRLTLPWGWAPRRQRVPRTQKLPFRFSASALPCRFPRSDCENEKTR